MSGREDMGGRYWPTSQQLVVVCGEPDLVAQWMDAVRDHHEACRDLIDCWDERYADPPLPLNSVRFGQALERVRHTLWQVRQWDVDT